MGQQQQQKRREKLGEKLKKGVLLLTKNVGPFASTPVRLWSFDDTATRVSTRTPVSVRKLGAAIWEFHQYNYKLPPSTMYTSVNNLNHINNGEAGESRFRRVHNHRHGVFNDKAFDLSQFLHDPSRSYPDQPESAGSLRRHIAAPLIQHHRSIDRGKQALQPVSPASHGSSMEVAAYNPAVTPTSSLEFRRWIGESSYSLKTSTELLKVLNRIWSLEEQHASNMSLIKGLKTELGHARLRIKELLRDQQTDRREIDGLMEEKLVQKSKEKKHLRAAIQSLRDELEDERKLRKRSESLHKKLARELSEVKLSLSNALKEMERERRSRKLLEDLCEEFAKGIKDYELEVHSLKQKFDKDWTGRADDNRLILQISELWLDERLQTTVASERGFDENNSIVDKLGYEIGTFLKAKRADSSRSTGKTLPKTPQNPKESVPVNEAVSTPQNVVDGVDSMGSDSHYIELNKPRNHKFDNMHGEEPVSGAIDEKSKSSQTKKKPASRERIGGRIPSSLQVRFEEQMAWARSYNGNNRTGVVASGEEKTGERNPIEMSISTKSEIHDVTEGAQPDQKNEADEIHGLNSNSMMDNLKRSHLSLFQLGNLHHKNDPGEASCSYSTRRNASPVRQWMPKLTPPDVDIPESSTKEPPGLKENTLKAKLLEARSRGQRSRVKLFNGSS